MAGAIRGFHPLILALLGCPAPCGRGGCHYCQWYSSNGRSNHNIASEEPLASINSPSPKGKSEIWAKKEVISKRCLTRHTTLVCSMFSLRLHTPYVPGTLHATAGEKMVVNRYEHEHKNVVNVKDFSQ